jgi:hypothetical protein
MSHVTSSSVIIKDLDALRAAVKLFPELQWCEGQKTYRWYGSWQNDYSSDDAAYKRAGIDPKDYGKCAHAIKCKGSEYDIGIVPLKTGGYGIIFDYYGTGRKIQEVVGEQACKLAQQYSRQVTIQAARKAGYFVREKVLPTGAIKLQLVKA